MSDNCPVASMYKEVNLANHLTTIRLANLGPPDPRQPSTLFWGDKMVKWHVPEGTARARLCMNCEEYNISYTACMLVGEGAALKASELPITPKWADIDGMPSAICDRWGITCAALRTCDDWEPVGVENGTVQE